MYEQRIEHTGLNQFRVIKANTVDDLRRKVEFQNSLWHERWAAKRATEVTRLTRAEKERQRDQRILSVEAAKREAEVQSQIISQQIQGLSALLGDVVASPAAFDWKRLEQHGKFPDKIPAKPAASVLPSEPDRAEQKYLLDVRPPLITGFDFILGRKAKKLAEFDEAKRVRARQLDLLFEGNHRKWELEVQRLQSQQRDALQMYSALLGEWNAKRREFEKRQVEHNESVQQFRADYSSRDLAAVQMYTTQVLLGSEYPLDFPKEVSITYLSEAGTLVVEYELPSIQCVPQNKEVKYVQVRRQFQDVPLSESARRKIYEEVLFQVCLRSLHELFTMDYADAFRTIVFNGWVHSIDRSTGQNNHICIMSVSVGKDEFLAINLSQVDPKACFRKLKGVAASKVTDLTPVRPVLTMDKDDARFVPAYAVVDGLDERTNLASMDWLDFENLIREIFEKEFSYNGGEVKITQASRDGGVDAIAFDPDPIRGGKIVIQAKRYTNTVGVSAVRDLYGTVLNEGATKGILVATSEFGTDSYEFAKGKPISLLSGAELLYLLEKHGHRAKIDIAEAKRYFADQKSTAS
jgi:restriction system protein